MSNTKDQLDAWDSSWKDVVSTVDESTGWALLDRIKIKKLMSYVDKRMRVLEVGCGAARLSSYLASKGHLITGLDYSSNALLAAAKNLSEVSGYQAEVDNPDQPSRVILGEHQLVLGDATKLPFADGSFDMVTSTGLLEHFVDPGVVVSEMTRVLRKGGLFYSDVVPKKFSSLRPMSMWRDLDIGGQVVYEGAYRKPDIMRWLMSTGVLSDVVVQAAGVLPPQRFFSGNGKIKKWIFSREDFWASLDGTGLAGMLGCYYFVVAKKV